MSGIIVQPAATLGEEPLERVFKQNVPWLLKHAQRICATREDAEDLVQEVFLRFVSAFQKIPLPEASRCTAWLAITLRNSFISSLRKTRVRERASGDPSFGKSVISLPEPAATSLEQTFSDEELQAAVRVLSRKQREAFEASAEGKPHEEIARLLGINRGAVAKRVHDARKRLRRTLVANHRRWENGSARPAPEPQCLAEPQARTLELARPETTLPTSSREADPDEGH